MVQQRYVFHLEAGISYHIGEDGFVNIWAATLACFLQAISNFNKADMNMWRVNLWELFLGESDTQNLLQLLSSLLHLQRQDGVSVYYSSNTLWWVCTMYWRLFRSALRSLFTYFGVNISAHCLWHPGRLVELSPPLLLWVPSHICHQLMKKKWNIGNMRKNYFTNTEKLTQNGHMKRSNNHFFL